MCHIVYFVILVVVIGIVVGLLLIILNRVESRGCCIYRGSAAEISVAKYDPKIKMLTFMNSNW